MTERVLLVAPALSFSHAPLHGNAGTASARNDAAR